MTGSLLRMDIRGRDGLPLADAWEDGPRTMLGLQIAGLPEPVHDHRPGQPVGAHEHAGGHRVPRRVDRRLHRVHARARLRAASRPPSEAQDAWVEHVAEVGQASLFAKANSWYVGANIPGKPRVVMPYAGGLPGYRVRCDAIERSGYEGFEFDGVTSDTAAVSR